MRINYSEKRNNINKPDALRSFCVACETFNFRETVQRLRYVFASGNSHDHRVGRIAGRKTVLTQLTEYPPEFGKIFSENHAISGGKQAFICFPKIKRESDVWCGVYHLAANTA